MPTTTALFTTCVIICSILSLLCLIVQHKHTNAKNDRTEDEVTITLPFYDKTFEFKSTDNPETLRETYEELLKNVMTKGYELGFENGWKQFGETVLPQIQRILQDGEKEMQQAAMQDYENARNEGFNQAIETMSNLDFDLLLKGRNNDGKKD